ncbi:MAG: hypothetical protein J6V25_13345 [Oscillospiraceae bacterium]|nr:hypothetical protein [Oscillospiraceae bacterium]
MKVCHNCRATFADNLAFCPNCGTQMVPNHPAYRQSFQKEPVSVGGWIGRSLIPFIPLVGGIVYLIMLFIWSGDTTKEDSFRNWAKAQLIVTAIVVALSIILAILFGTVLADTMYY